MKKSLEFIKERAAHIEAQKRLHEKAEKEKRDLNEEETKEFRDLQGKIAALSEKIKDAEAYEENLRSIASTDPQARSVKPKGEGGEEGEKKKMRSRLMIGKALMEARNGKLTGVEAEINAIGIEERNTEDAPANSFNLPASMVRNETRAAEQTVTQDSGEYGGELVHDNAPRVLDSFLPKTFLETLGATMFTGLTGGDVPLPVAGSYDFGWYDETEEATTQKTKFTGPKLSPKRAAAVVMISNRLLMQSSIDVQSKIISMLGQGAARAINNVAINGLAASKQPVGLLNLSGVQSSTQAAAAAATFARIVELQGLVSSADSTEVSLGYLMNPKLEAALKTITKDAGSGRFLLEGGMLDGYKYVASSLVAAIEGTPDTYPLIYGDFSQMFLGQWGGIQFVTESAAAANSIKVVVNMHADMQVALPKAFAVNTFLTV